MGGLVCIRPKARPGPLNGREVRKTIRSLGEAPLLGNDLARSFDMQGVYSVERN